MSEDTKHEPGTPSWADLGTTDAKAAVTFYSGLFGWETEEGSAGPAGTYIRCRRDGKDVVGLYEQDEAMRSRGVPPMWLLYITVEDVAAAAVAVGEAGGTLHAQPFDVADSGKMALAQDPTGAMFALWQANERPGAEVLHEPGAMDWFELTTNDPEKAGAFYEQVLGWTINSEEFDGTPYTTCLRGDEPVAGILPAESLPEGVAPNWGIYFAVEDCAAAVETVTSSGGEVLFGPLEMPSVGQFAGLRDPQGATFAVIQPAPPEQDDDEADGESEESADSGEGEKSEHSGSEAESEESAQSPGSEQAQQDIEVEEAEQSERPQEGGSESNESGENKHAGSTHAKNEKESEE